MNNIMEAISGVIGQGLEKAFTRRIIRIDTTKHGDEVVTIQNENGQLEHLLKKLVDTELIEQYEIQNR
jgi:hypothetical protein